MDRDGMKEGYDNYLNKAVTDRIKIPLMASGGYRTLEHAYDTLNTGNASLALTESISHYNKYTYQEVKDYLRKWNTSIRN